VPAFRQHNIFILPELRRRLGREIANINMLCKHQHEKATLAKKRGSSETSDEK